MPKFKFDSSLLLFSAIALVVLILDQIAKYWVLNHIAVQPSGMGLSLQDEYMRTIIPKVLGFIHTRNDGAAFSLFNAHSVILTVVAVLLALGVLAWAIFSPENTRFTRIALGLIFGGAMGNIADRFLHDFQVVDFILVLITLNGNYWPTFNVADVAICVGIGLFLIAAYLATSKTEAPETELPPSSEE
jgi:signal peptidase II